MHSIHTFVLRLLFDTQDPGVLRGSLRAVGEDEDYTFVGDQNLCALVARLMQDQAGMEGAGGEGQSGGAEGELTR